MKHFKSKSNEGCQVCLCKNWFYHSIPSGFPGSEEVDMKCPNCGKPIGSEKNVFLRNFFLKVILLLLKGIIILEYLKMIKKLKK